MRGNARRRTPPRRPLSDHGLYVLRRIEGTTLGQMAVTLDDALGRPATPRDWRSAEVLVSRGLVHAADGRVRISAAGARVLGRIP